MPSRVGLASRNERGNMVMNENEVTESVKIGEAIERILIESGLSITAFSRKVGYSRQYIYELLKAKEDGTMRKIQLDTLKKICDSSGYPLERLLGDIGYIPRPKTDYPPNTLIVVRKNGDKATYALEERDAALIEGLAKSLAGKEPRR